MSRLSALLDEFADSAVVRQALVAHSEQVGGLASWAWNLESDELVWSDNAFHLLGMEPDELQPSVEHLASLIHPDDRSIVDRVIDGIRAGRPATEIYRVIRADGEILHLEISVVTITGRGVAVGVVRDLTETREAEREITALVRVSRTLNQWDGFEGSARRLLEAVALPFGFERGVLWVPVGDVLESRVIWGYQSGSQAFERTRELRLSRGEGLAGRAWQAQSPVTLSNVADAGDYPFREVAGQSQLRGAAAIPLMAGVEVLGVMGLAGPHELKLTERLEATLTAVGYEIGSFLARRGGALSPPPLSARELEVLQLATEGLGTREIAERLHISPATVKSHFEHVYAKYGVDGRAAAVAKAVRQGLIS